MKINIHQQILDSAERLIQTKGYNAFSYKDIATIVGVKTSSIHYYFPTKADLGKEVVKKHVEVLCADMQQLLQQPNVSYRKKLDLFVDFIFTHTYLNDNKMCLGGMLASDVLTLPDVVQHEVRSFFAKIESWLEQLLKLGKKQGEFSFKGNVKEEAHIIIATIEGSLLLARLFQDEGRLSLAKKQIMARFNEA